MSGSYPLGGIQDGIPAIGAAADAALSTSGLVKQLKL